MCDSKKSIKLREASELFSTLGIKTPLNKILLSGPLLFWRYKINEIVNKLLLAGDKCMPEVHIRQSGFAYSTYGQFTKNKKRIQKFKETGNSRYIHHNKLDKGCFSYDMAYENFKDLSGRKASDKILRDKAFNIAKNPKYDGCQRGPVSMVYTFFDKKTSGGAATLAWAENVTTQNKPATKNKNISNAESAAELSKPIIETSIKKSSITLYRQYLACRFSR